MSPCIVILTHDSSVGRVIETQVKKLEKSNVVKVTQTR